MKEIVTIAGESLELYAHRTIFWPSKSILLLADLHWGKINHFRKSGVPVPIKANEKNIESIIEIIQRTKPQQVIFLGDLFHSHYNDEWEVLGQLIKHFAAVEFHLVLGNHDILSEHQYNKHGLILHNQLIIEPFILTHHPLQQQEQSHYNLAGHIHPGVHLIGKGKQRLTLPCFYFGEWQGLLPAFGAFTGLSRITPQKNDQVYVIVENKILKM